MWEVEDNKPVVDTFPAFDFDGYSLRSGLLQSAGDFDVTVLRNGELIGLPVTITEIPTSTGHYRINWIPPYQEFGYYEIKVLITFNKDWWGGSYNVVDELPASIMVGIKNQVDKIDLAPTLGPAAVFSGSLMDRFMNKNVNKTYNQGTDSLEAIRDVMI